MRIPAFAKMNGWIYNSKTSATVSFNPVWNRRRRSCGVLACNFKGPLALKNLSQRILEKNLLNYCFRVFKLRQPISKVFCGKVLPPFLTIMRKKAFFFAGTSVYETTEAYIKKLI